MAGAPELCLPTLKLAHKTYELCYDACYKSRLCYDPLRTLTREMTVKIRENLTIHTRKRA